MEAWIKCFSFRRFIGVLMYIVFLIISMVQVCAQKSLGSKCTLHILSALPFPEDNTALYNTDYNDGPDIIPAGYLAVEMINNRSDILSDYDLQLIEGHDGCGSTQNSPVEYLLLKDIFNSGKNIVGIAGPRCYVSAEVGGLITAKGGIALVNVHESSSFDLGKTELYPYSFGATPSIERLVDAYIALVTLNKWRHVGVITQDDTGSYAVLKTLSTKLSHLEDYEVSFSAIITENYLPLDGLQASSARAILVCANSNLARMLMCAAYTKGAMFPQYQWTFLYRGPKDFIDTSFQYKGRTYNCSQADLLVALNKSITINFSYEPNLDDWNKTGISGLTYPQYKEEYARAVERYNNGQYGPPVRTANTTLWGNPFHDAVWILALGLNATDAQLRKLNKSLCTFGYGQPSVAYMIQEEISKLDFLGAGGRIVYNNSQRFTPGVVKVWQVTENCSQLLGYFSEKSILHLTQESNSTFLHIQDQRYQLSLVPLIIFLTTSLIALIFTVILNVLNVIFRHHESVKASSHRLNHMAYVGSYLLSVAIIMLTLTEGSSFPLPVKNVICNGVPWVASIGFTTVYATVTMKLFRIYRVLIVAVEKFQKPSGKKLWNDSVLLAAIVALVIPDIVICTSWQCVDPIQIKSRTSIQKDDTKLNYVTYESCFMHSTHNLLPWLLSLFIYNGILCGIATFIAFLTRSISVKNFRTGNILLISALQLVLYGVSLPTIAILIINHSESSSFITSLYITTCLLFSGFVYICLFLLFLPPLYPVIKPRCVAYLAQLKTSHA